VDFAERYKSPPVQLDDEAKNVLINYPWPGNVRELKNIAEQISVLSRDKNITGVILRKFLPDHNSRLPVLVSGNTGNNPKEFANEREILYKLFFDMKKDVTELKKMFFDVIQNPAIAQTNGYQHEHSLNEYHPNQHTINQPASSVIINGNSDIHQHIEVEESLSIMDKEKELIIKALKKHRGKRKDASADLGISERTLYRKLKEYDIDE
jgi:DNA-binding NtrC family response regulator